jgi:hypothetical protein
VDLVEKQVRRELEAAPQRRPRPVEIDPDAVRDDLAAPGPPAGRRRLPLEQACKWRPGGERALQRLLDSRCLPVGSEFLRAAGVW